MEQGKQENWQAKPAKHGLGEKKGGGARRLCFDAAYSPTCNYPVRDMSIR